MDLVMTAFCVITLLFIFFAGCGNTSKEEELLDTLLLVARNVLQFGRLAAVMRQYVLFHILILRNPNIPPLPSRLALFLFPIVPAPPQFMTGASLRTRC